MNKGRVAIVLLALGLMMGCGKKEEKKEDGLSLMTDKKYEEAIAYYEKDIKDGKKVGEAYHMIGVAHFEMGEYQEAVEALENASENDVQKTAIFYSLMADSYMEVGEYERALAYYSKAARKEDISEELKQKNAFNEIAIYQELGEWDIVKEKAEAYVKEYPEDDRMDKTMEFLETR